MSKNVLLQPLSIVPIEDKAQAVYRKYTHSGDIVTLAVNKYRNGGWGITYTDLISRRISNGKMSAQRTLKYMLASGKLFTIANYKPQQYFPSSIKAEIIENRKKLQENGLVDPTRYIPTISPLHNALEFQKMANVLDHLVAFSNSLPLYIHRMQLRTYISKEYYNELDTRDGLTFNEMNKAKVQTETIGNSRVQYSYSPNGRIQIYSTSSRQPFKLENEEDLAILYSFFGQIRDRMIHQVSDIHEREIRQITHWTLTGADLNKDIPINEKMQLTLPKVQLISALSVFRMYVKILGDKAVWRVEESISPNVRIPQVLDNALNSREFLIQNVVNKINQMDSKLEAIHTIVRNSKQEDINVV